MFVVLLKFSEHKAKAKSLMQDHMVWLQQGFDDGVFLLSGSIKPGLGGAILATGQSRDQLELRVDQDPFVIAKVVDAEILEIDASKTNDQLAFLSS